MEFLKKYYGLLLILTLSILAIIPLFLSGMFVVHDNLQVARIIEMTRSLQDGMFPVRWVKDLGFGYGYPIFNFYGPLPYYVGSVFYALGLPAVTAAKIMIGIGVVVAGVSMYLLIRRIYGELASLTAAVVYIFFPYHAINTYVRGAIGELYAYAFLPLIFLGIYTIYDKQKNKHSRFNLPGIAITSVSFFLIAVSHNLSIFMVMILAPIFTLALFLYSRNKINLLVNVALGFSLGLLMSSFYIIPAFTEMMYTNVVSQVGGGADFRDHFVCLLQLWDSPWGFGGSTSGCVDGISFRIGKTNILALTLGISFLIYALFKKKGKKTEVAITSVICFGISVVLCLSVSQSFWENVPYMAYLQFPWRFLNFVGLFTSIIIGYSIFYLSGYKKINFSIFLAIIIIGSTLLFNQKLFYGQHYEFYPEYYYTSPAYLNLTASNISFEYMPKGFVKPEDESQTATSKFELIGEGNISTSHNTALKLSGSYEVLIPSKVLIKQADFPTWKLFINNQSKAKKAEKNGIVAVLPQGKGTVELRFEETTIEKISNLISLVAISIFVGIMVQLMRKKNSKHA